MDTIADLRNFADVLSRRGYSSEDVEGILYRNFVEVFRRAGGDGAARFAADVGPFRPLLAEQLSLFTLSTFGINTCTHGTAFRCRREFRRCNRFPRLVVRRYEPGKQLFSGISFSNHIQPDPVIAENTSPAHGDLFASSLVFVSKRPDQPSVETVFCFVQTGKGVGRILQILQSGNRGVVRTPCPEFD